MNYPATLSAEQAAEYLGYGCAQTFRLAVERGVYPKPIDQKSRPMRWSKAQIDAVIAPANEQSTIDQDKDTLAQMIGGRR